MNRLVLDAELRSKLGNFAEPLELCDASGRILGRLLPARDLSGYEPCEPPIGEEEARRREQSTEWYSTAEVLDRLQGL